ncbi:hypothetical protein G6L37_00230 [Agrobacterium rubi]|nr:hypothetical protein [Agrobacterium rubi]NTF23677.1 hypothetical protein [Agrobacterium rubi]
MYDREPRYPMVDTLNAARLEYTLNGMTHMESRRADIIRISKSQAVLSLITRYSLPTEFYLDLPDARIGKVGCKLMKSNANNTIEIRFLRLLTDKELNRIFVYSTHPSHRDVKLDIRA